MKPKQNGKTHILFGNYKKMEIAEEEEARQAIDMFRGDDVSAIEYEKYCSILSYDGCINCASYTDGCNSCSVRNGQHFAQIVC